MIQIQDVLKSPIGTPLAFAKLYFYAITSDEVLPTSKAVVDTIAEDGVVDISLVRGTYRVYLKQCEGGVQYHVGYVNDEVFDTVTSPVRLADIISPNLSEEIN